MRYSHFLFKYLSPPQTGTTNQKAKGREMSEDLSPVQAYRGTNYIILKK